MKTAGLTNSDLDSPRNGMLLCGAHHRRFDKYKWTVDAGTFGVIERTETGSVEMVAQTMMDFSHRLEHHRPPARLWNAYNTHIFADEGEALKAATESKPKAKPSEGAVGAGAGGKP